MRLGESLRRTRERGPGWIRRLRLGPGTGEGGIPWVAKLAGLGLVGWLVGYLIATQLVFPAPPPPPGLVEVPDVRGVGVALASERAAAAGLVLDVGDSLHHPSVAAGLVLGQAPLPGQLALPGSELWVAQSLGSQSRTVPDMVGVDGERARVMLETSGFLVDVDTVQVEAPRGRVVRLEPPPGTAVSIPSSVRMVVSLGPPLARMPSVIGLEEADAIERIQAAGLVVGEVTEIFRFGRDQGIVVEQTPPAGTDLERGSAVRLAIGRRGG